jgi:GT2 family glycosyltransferase
MPELAGAEVLAVVVVHRVDQVATRRSLQSLTASVGVHVEVVAALNGGDEQLALLQPITRELGITLLNCGRNRGFGAAVNRAIAGAGGPPRHVFLLNDDAWVEPDTLRRCIDTMDAAGERCISVGPLVVHADHPDLVDSLGVVLRPNGEAFNALAGQPAAGIPARPTKLLGPCFAAALFRPGAFEPGAVGPIDERYFLYYEDVDWNLRAAHRGWTSVSAPGAIAHHQHALSTRRLGEAHRYGLVQRNLLVCASTDLSRRSAARVWAQRLVVHTKGLVTGPYRWQRVRSVAGALVRLPGSIARRHTHRGDAPRPDPELFAFSEGLSPGIDPTTYAPY